MPPQRKRTADPEPAAPPAAARRSPVGVATQADDEARILRHIVEGTARATGVSFFQSLVRHLASALDARHAFVAEFAGSTARVRTVAFWTRNRIGENVEWDLGGTPCEDVVRGKLCHHPTGVARLFPSDRPLVEMGIESYLGVPLFDADGKVVGHLAVFDERPMPADARRADVLGIFAARAAAELERVQMERRLRDAEHELRDLFDEAPIPYVYEDTDTRFLRANRAFMKLLGLKPGDVPGTLGLSLVSDAADVQQRLQASLAAEQSGRERGCIEIELRRKDDGRSVWVQRWSKPMPDGRQTRTMIVDITARVLAERERNRLQAQNLYLQEEIKTESNFDEIIGGSPALRAALGQVGRVAATDSTVLILGETGTGKELFARAIHNGSRRRNRPLIKLNCAALPTGLVESELFGHEKGAFTGAVEKRVGRFALADGGTIFLDEIGDMPLEVQVRLLRVLQEQEFEPVGSARTVKVDVRVIAATNRDLERAVADGQFRADLYYRLNVFPIHVAPLRDRREDIPLLAHYFTARYAAKMGRTIEAIGGDTVQRLVDYPWPGNIRELENIIERAVILSQGAMLEIEPHALRAPARAAVAASSTTRSPDTRAATEDHGATTASDNERLHIVRALERTRWVIEGERGAAKILDLHPNTLRSRMKKLGIRREG